MTAPSTARPDPVRARAAATAVGVAGVGLVVAVVGPDLPGGSSLCPTHALLGIDCPACGATRGLHDLATGDLAGALSHNLLLAVVLPLLALWWSGQVRAAAIGGPVLALPRLRRRTWTGIILAVGAFAVVRNLDLPGLGWLDAA